MTYLAITGLATRLGAYRDLDAFISEVITGACADSAPAQNTWTQADVLTVLGEAAAQADLNMQTLPIILGVDERSTRSVDDVTAMLPTAPVKVLTGTETLLFAALVQLARTLPENGSSSAIVIAAPEGTLACVITRREFADERQVLALIDSDMIADHIDLAPVGGARAVSALEWVGGKVSPRALEGFTVPGGDLTCVISSAEPVLGMPSVLASFAKVVRLLHRRTHAPWTEAQSRPDLSDWTTLPFYTAPKPRPWFAERDIGQRITALVTPSSSLVLFGETQTARPLQRYASQPYARSAYLIPLAGTDEADLRRKLGTLREELLSSASLPEIATRAGARYQKGLEAPYAMALVVRSIEQLRKEVDLALGGLEKAFATGKAWNTPRGSTFTAQPQGEHGVAFVYPGAFNAYLGLGRELFLAFPMLNEWLSDFISNIGRSVAERSLFPRSRQPLSDDVLAEFAGQFMQNPVAMITAGTTFSVAYTLLMQNLFRVRPRAAFGYSLGEISMLWSSGVWRSGDAASDAWLASPLYRTRLCGPKEVVRDAWQVPEGEQADWATWLLKARRNKVEALVGKEPRVYLTITNLKNEVVIAGEPAGCKRIIDALDCHALRAPFDSVIHNPLARAEYDTFLKLYTHPVVARPDCDFYTAATYKPLVLDDRALAHSVADMCCQPVDFPRLVNSVADSGPRVFVELGAQATCTRWISRIMRGTPHAAVSINRPRVGDYESVLTVLAQLVTHRVPVELTPVFAPHWSAEQTVPVPKQTALPRPRPVAPVVKKEIMPVAVLPTLEPELLAVAVPSVPVQTDDTRYRAFSEAVLPQRRQVAQSQVKWLQGRSDLLKSNTELIQMQIALAEQWLTGRTTSPSPIQAKAASSPTRGEGINPSNRESFVFSDSLTRPLLNRSDVLLDHVALEEFSKGDITRCLGDAYRIFDGRRLPRIPNSELLLIDRVLHTDAVPSEFAAQPSMTAEVDVPVDAWYFANSEVIPTPILMEMALQPCGVLSAWMHTPMLDPDSDLYFRNLDGKGTLLREPHARGKTIRNTVKLLSTTRVKGIILQRFSFIMSCDGEPFYVGESSFGYFEKAALARQAGFGDVENAHPWLHKQQGLNVNPSALPTAGMLDFVNAMKVVPGAGKYGSGYAYGEVPVVSDDWYFSCHFHEDPVMPGSLGIAAAQQALYAASGVTGAPRDAVGVETVWRYRGQVVRTDGQIAVEVHVKEIAERNGVIQVTGDAGLYNRGVLIYDVQNLTISSAQ